MGSLNSRGGLGLGGTDYSKAQRKFLGVGNILYLDSVLVTKLIQLHV